MGKSSDGGFPWTRSYDGPLEIVSPRGAYANPIGTTQDISYYANYSKMPIMTGRNILAKGNWMGSRRYPVAFLYATKEILWVDS